MTAVVYSSHPTHWHVPPEKPSPSLTYTVVLQKIKDKIKAFFCKSVRRLHGCDRVDRARVGRWKRKERVQRRNIKINQIINISVGPSDEAVGSRCVSSFKTKIPNIVLSLEYARV